MKRLLNLIILSLVLFTGCNKDELLPTKINVQLESVSGSRARFTVAPENPHAYYTYVLVYQGDSLFNAPAVDICNQEIRRMEDSFEYFESGSYTDVFCYRGSRQFSMESLASDVEFKFIVFQINPKTHELIGDPTVCGFRTKHVPTRDLHFDVNFEYDILQITPSDDNFTYIWQFEESEMINNIYGDPVQYIYKTVGMYQEYGFLEYYYSQGESVWDLSMESNMVDGREYTLIICGCEESEFTTPATIVIFKYHPGNIEVLEVIEGNEEES